MNYENNRKHSQLCYNLKIKSFTEVLESDFVYASSEEKNPTTFAVKSISIPLANCSILSPVNPISTSNTTNVCRIFWVVLDEFRLRVTNN